MNQRNGATCRRRSHATWALGLALLLAGCQPKAVPSIPDRAQPPKTGAGGAAPSRTTESTSKVAPADEPASASETTGAPSSPPETSGTPAAPEEPARPTAEAKAPNSDTAEKKPAARPTARRPSAPGEPLEISFDDLVIGMQADVVYRPWMLTDRAKEVDGQKVKLVGYVHPGVDKQKHIKELVLLRNTECKFGPGGQADHLVRVFFQTDVNATFTKNAVEVQGVLKINPWEGPDRNTWSLYDLEATGFKDLRRP